MLNYNKFYDNKKYNALAEKIAEVMNTNYDAPSQSYLDIMVKVQDAALYACHDIENRPVYTANELCILYDVKVFDLYMSFTGLF